jgi:hypothetical protein
LQRIVEVSGIRLDDPDERLAAALHLRLIGDRVSRESPSATSEPA